jgi:hypothetical protein
MSPGERPEQTACLLAHSDASYVLGALSPMERLEYERHLPTCEPCRRSVAQLAGVPGLLGRVPVSAVEDPAPEDPVPPAVLPALVARVRREQRRRTVLLSLGAAAAVAAVAVGAAAFQANQDDGRSPEAVPTTASPSVAPFREMKVVEDWGMAAQVSLTSEDGGTNVQVNCTYPDESASTGHAYHYVLVAFTRDGGSRWVTDWWAAPGDPPKLIPGFTGIQLADMTKVEVQSDHGTPILRLKL